VDDLIKVISGQLGLKWKALDNAFVAAKYCVSQDNQVHFTNLIDDLRGVSMAPIGRKKAQEGEARSSLSQPDHTTTKPEQVLSIIRMAREGYGLNLEKMFGKYNTNSMD